MTLRQLLSHTSGLRDAFEIGLRFNGVESPIARDQLVAMYRDIDDVDALPGTRCCYNSGAYVLLGAMLERISGRPLQEVLAERVLEPAGLYDTCLRGRDTDLVANSATLHMGSAGRGFEKRYFGIERSGDSGLISTVDDMLRWLAHMDNPVVGQPETWLLMRTPGRLVDGRLTRYGLGLMRDSYRGLATTWHLAGMWGGSAQVMKVAEAALDIVVLSNRADVWAADVAKSIIDACVAGLPPEASEPAKLPDTRESRSELGGDDAILGLYRSQGTHTDACIERRGDTIVLTTTGQFGSSSFHLERATPAVWRATSTFHPALDGTVELIDTGISFSCERISALPFQLRSA